MSRPSSRPRREPQLEWRPERDDNLDRLQHEFPKVNYQKLREVYEQEAQRDYSKARDILQRMARSSDVLVEKKGGEEKKSGWNPFASSGGSPAVAPPLKLTIESIRPELLLPVDWPPPDREFVLGGPRELTAASGKPVLAVGEPAWHEEEAHEEGSVPTFAMVMPYVWWAFPASMAASGGVPQDGVPYPPPAWTAGQPFYPSYPIRPEGSGA